MGPEPSHMRSRGPAMYNSTASLTIVGLDLHKGTIAVALLTSVARDRYLALLFARPAESKVGETTFSTRIPGCREEQDPRGGLCCPVHLFACDMVNHYRVA